MKKFSLYGSLMLTVFASCASIASAQDSFATIRFDFEGPNIPTEWIPGVWPDGTREIVDGSFVITAPTDFGGASSDFSLGHTNLVAETQIRFLEDGAREDYATILIRSTDGVADGYFGSVSSEGTLLLGRTIADSSVDPNFQATATGFNAVDQDLKLRLVAAGSTIDLFAWPADSEPPLSPTLSLTDSFEDAYEGGNEISLLSSSFQNGARSWPVAFRYVEISPVPEPSSSRVALIGIAITAMLVRKRAKIR